jgi:hypothetical protein
MRPFTSLVFPIVSPGGPSPNFEISRQMGKALRGKSFRGIVAQVPRATYYYFESTDRVTQTWPIMGMISPSEFGISI